MEGKSDALRVNIFSERNKFCMTPSGGYFSINYLKINELFFFLQEHRPSHLIKKNFIQTRNRKNKKVEPYQTNEEFTE